MHCAGLRLSSVLPTPSDKIADQRIASNISRLHKKAPKGKTHDACAARMVVLVRDVLSGFFKPANIPIHVEDLLALDITDKNVLYPNKRLYVGRFCFHTLNRARIEKKSMGSNCTVYSSLREGYIKCASFLLKNLPLSNQTIKSLSALSPSLFLHESMADAFTTLAETLPNIVKTEEIGQLVEEVRANQIDPQLQDKSHCFDETTARIDVDWWSAVISTKVAAGELKFPIMGKLVKALLLVFTGPLVEGQHFSSSNQSQHFCSSNQSQQLCSSNQASSSAPPTKASSSAPPTKASSSAPPTKASTSAPPTKASSSAPQTKASTSAPPTKASTSAPPTKASTSAPPTKASTSAPPAKAHSYAPPTKASTSAPPTKDSSSAPSNKANPPTKCSSSASA
ncbi:hypothetical protein WMY93_018112 [Mugilogobius chulae]|uniref:Uncharacterized protein n=1 Tax=Mugilogobius chulae TaxID=88201 RepID=A0AAW0NKM9_9GOBI